MSLLDDPLLRPDSRRSDSHRAEPTLEFPVLDATGSPTTPEPPTTTPSPVRSAGTVTAQMAGSVLLPGVATRRRRPVTALLLFVTGVLLPIALLGWMYVRRAELLGVTLQPTFLALTMAIATLSIVARVVAVVETTIANRRAPGTFACAAVAMSVVAVAAVPVWSFVSETAATRTAVNTIFDAGSSEPLYTPAGPQIATDGTLIDPNAMTNVLIIGGDAGPGRWGMRTDTMMIASIHDASSRMGLVSIPRNLTSLRFPPGSPLAAEFPDGFDDLANALFTHVNGRPELVEHYGRSGARPEAAALAEAIGYSFNLRIDDYALVNMQGFTEVIDALGGVTVELGQTVPLPPSLPGERPLPPEIGPGLVDMDGALAIAYARSRAADSDYERMGRQRQLLAALSTQVSAADAAGAFVSVTGMLEDSMRTSLTAGEFDRLLDRFSDNSAIVQSVGLAPPLITPGAPDYALIASIVADVQQQLIDAKGS